MIKSETDLARHGAVAQAVSNRIRAQTRGQIRALEVDCDGEVVTIRGEVDSDYFQQLAFNAAWIEARNADGLLFDFKVVVADPPKGTGYSSA